MKALFIAAAVLGFLFVCAQMSSARGPEQDRFADAVAADAQTRQDARAEARVRRVVRAAHEEAAR